MSVLSNKIPPSLRLYAILNLVEPPRLLISGNESGQFHCYFALPLPPQIIVFRLGESNCVGYNSRMSITVCLDSETPSFEIGCLENNVHSVCLKPKWSEDFLTRSHMLYEKVADVNKDRMAKLLITIEDGVKNGFHTCLSNVTPEKLQQLEKRQLVVKLSNELTPPFSTGISSSSPDRLLKKEKDVLESSKESMPKRKRESFGDCNNNHLVQRTLTSSFKKVAKICPSDLEKELLCETVQEKSGVWPSSRWGHSGCVVKDRKVVIIGGQGVNYQMVKDSLYVLDCDSKTWKEKSTERNGADRRMGHTSTYDIVKNVIYVYGGSKNKRWFKDVHILDVATWKWTDVKAVGNAPRRAYHSAVLFQDELVIFGGVYPNPDPIPDGCSNDLFMFNPETKSWYQPIVNGEQPLPRSGHSLLLYSESKAIIFGGWDAPKCYNDVYFLDLALMEYTKPNITGTKPTPRSWHSSTLPSRNCLFIHGGFDGAENTVLGDSFIFDIEKLTWLKVNTCPEIPACVGHFMFSCDDGTNDKKQVIIFGGGDNNGNFFNNLLSVQTKVGQKL